MSSKLRIRIGEVEVDFEGTEEFIKNELPDLLKTAMQLHDVVASSEKSKSASGKSVGSGGAAAIGSKTTATIAARLNAKTGPDLLIAAACQLSFVAKKDTFSRQALLTEMQSAAGYYKKSHSNNLSKYLKGAISDNRLTETAKNTYALTATERSDCEKKLANT